MDLYLKKHLNNITSRERIEDKGNFLKRIGILLDEGYSLKNALSFLEKIETGLILSWIHTIQKGLLRGQTFHEGLKNIGFSSKTCSQIYFASQFGEYPKAITRCGEQLLLEIDRKKKMKSLLSYPMLLVFFLITMLLIMRFLIFPHMESLFFTTQNTQSIYSNYLVLFIYYSPQILLVMLSTLFFFYLLVKRKISEQTIIDQFKLFTKIPFLNPYLKDYWTNFFFLEWGQLLINGCSFQEIISIMKEDEASRILKETGEFLSIQLKKGQTITESLNHLPFFHQEGILIIAHGEKSGNLPLEMLLYASYCEEELAIRIEKFMNMIQPIIFSFIALMIVGIYASLILPIFSLMEVF